ncbi:ABC transporter permease [uncultured Draconibacterium sp.]|uniref:ABC transporter permease n=1 Tax=uncultured Draconibacterium sp. TaxID=1573823 RepID=UPI0025E74147|nr:ABC transporter permease [uncultured Draconibacterium sp.]
MKTISYILQKEFRQIFRNRTMLPMIFMVPIIQMLILVFAATYDMKKIDMVIVDHDLSENSKELIAKFNGIPFFNMLQLEQSEKLAEQKLLTGEADVVLVFPMDFERKLIRHNHTNIQLLVNAIESNSAQLIYTYAANIVADYNQQIISEWKAIPEFEVPAQINIAENYWYNTELDYKWFMAPGILAILVTLIGMFMSGMNLVREKEIGTIEQLNVTPLKKYQFIIGKLVPFWIIGLFDLAFGLAIAWLVFDLPIVGSLFTLFFMAGIYLIGILGLGLFISTLADTQQQVMFVSFFFLMMFILMGGIFTPVESMPDWAQTIDHLNPLYYFMRIMRMVVLKGSGFTELLRELISLTFLGITFLSLAIWRYRKTA